MNSKIKIISLIALILIAAGVFWMLNYRKQGKPITGSASLSWSPNSEADLAGYKVYYGTSPRTGDCSPGGYAKNIDVKKNTQYAMNNLEPGKTYYFSVTSYNTSGKESCFSEEMKKTISLSVKDRLKRFFTGN